MRHVRGFTLVGIVEFIMYRCTRYFRERYQAAAALLNDPRVVFLIWSLNTWKKRLKSSLSQSGLHRHKASNVWGFMQGQDRSGCPQTKGGSELLDNAGRQGVLQMQEATTSSLTMLPCHCGMFRIWIESWGFCFWILQKRNRCAHLGPWDIWHRQSGIIHYTKYLSNLHSQSRC